MTQPPVTFHYALEVPWSDTDAGQIVWFGNYIKYVEKAEVALFAALGHPLPQMFETHKIFTPRTHLTCAFRSPARFTDVLTVALTVASATDRRISFAFEITNDATGAIVTQGEYRIACVDVATFKACPFPAEVTARFNEPAAFRSARSAVRTG